MDRAIVALTVASAVLIVFAAMWLGWRRNRRDAASLGALEPVELAAQAPRFATSVLYLATTRADAPLERVAVAGLAYRARGTVALLGEGLALALDGGPARLIPREAVRGYGRANWTIDRGTGRDGLVLVRWRLGDTDLDSYLRPADPAGLIAALTEGIPA